MQIGYKETFSDMGIISSANIVIWLRLNTKTKIFPALILYKFMKDFRLCRNFNDLQINAHKYLLIDIKKCRCKMKKVSKRIVESLICLLL